MEMKAASHIGKLHLTEILWGDMSVSAFIPEASDGIKEEKINHSWL